MLQNGNTFFAVAALGSGLGAGYSHRVNTPGITFPPGEVWTPMDNQSRRDYGTGVLVPKANPADPQDLVMDFGGMSGAALVIDTKWCIANATAAPGWNWSVGPALNTPRVFLNSVILPDATILALGGKRVANFTAYPPPNATLFAYAAEQYGADGVWVVRAAMQGTRDYHSTAILLPSGKVLYGGGESRRNWPPGGSCNGGTDYELYVPQYLAKGAPQPTTYGYPAAMTYADPNPYTITYTLNAGLDGRIAKACCCGREA